MHDIGKEKQCVLQHKGLYTSSIFLWQATLRFCSLLYACEVDNRPQL